MAPHIPVSDSQDAVVRVFTVLGTIAVSALLVAVGLYVVWFGRPVGFRFSAHAEDWSRFAEYLGGTLGPVYSLLAFLGVLMTVLLQSKQIADLRAQGEQQGLQQVLATLSGKLDETLRAVPEGKPPRAADFASGAGEPDSLRSWLSVAGCRALLAETKAPVAIGQERRIAEIKERVTPEVATLNRELGQLVQCLKEYRASGGSESIRFHYLDRYTPVVGYLTALKFPVTDEVMNAFDLAYAKALVLREARAQDSS
jgi:hypothetical protein